MSETLILSESTPVVTEVVVQDTLVSETGVNTTVVVEVSETIIVTGQNETLIVEAAPGTNATVLTVGIQGPAGPGGGAEAGVYAQRADLAGSPVLYRAEAEPGSEDDEAVWRIRKLTLVIVDGLISLDTAWADDSDEFDKVWNDRASYAYL